MIDYKDKKILNLLIENSRLSCREMARKLRINVVTVLNRIKRMEKEGVIKKQKNQKQMLFYCIISKIMEKERKNLQAFLNFTDL